MTFYHPIFSKAHCIVALGSGLLSLKIHFERHFVIKNRILIVFFVVQKAVCVVKNAVLVTKYQFLMTKTAFRKVSCCSK